jgi:uncharacterized CHY-type Zn-finger protein
MTNGKKAKRPDWKPPPPKPTTPPDMEICSVCKRRFRPLPDNKTGTCVNCQKEFTTAAKLLAAEKLRQSQHPVKRLFESFEPEPKALADKARTIACNKCGKKFLSTGFENCTCDSCRESNSNISNLATPSSQGYLSRTD